MYPFTGQLSVHAKCFPMEEMRSNIWTSKGMDSERVYYDYYLLFCIIHYFTKVLHVLLSPFQSS